MIINDKGRDLLMTFEGCRLEAYKCPAGVTTIGFGHTGDVEMGQKITLHQAEAILEYDLHRFEQGVTELAPHANANEFSSLVSFSFNLGLHALKMSTLLRFFNAGQKNAAAGEFLKWTRAGGKVLPGLVKRRAAERALFLEVPS